MFDAWPNRIRRNWHEEYPKYLASPEWKQRRKLVMQGCGSRCRCGHPATEVHHKTYDRVGAEDLDDLEGVCSECHQDIHRIEGKERRKPPTKFNRYGRQKPQSPTRSKRKRKKRNRKKRARTLDTGFKRYR